MSITPGVGYMLNPADPTGNSVVPIGSSAQAQGLGSYNTGTTPTANIAYGATNTNPAPTNTTITKTSSAPAQTSTPAPTYSGAINNSINNTPQGNALVNSNQQQAAALGVSIPGAGSSGTTSGFLSPAPTSAPPQTSNTNIGQTSGTGNTTLQSATNTLGNISTNGSPNAQAAATGALGVGTNQDAYNTNFAAYTQAVNDYTALQKQVNDQLAAVGLQPGIPYQAVEGQQQIIALRAAQDLDNAQKKVAALADVLNAGISEQNAQSTAFSTAGGIANTAQSNSITGLSSAGTLASPGNTFIQQAPANTLVGANGQPINQTTGTGISALTGQPFTSTGNAKVDSAISAALQMIKNGSGYTNAVNAQNISSYGPAATAALQSGLPSGFNINSSDATAAGQATLTSQLPTLQGAVNKAGGIEQTIESLIQNNPTINSDKVGLANAATQFLNGTLVPDPKYQSLFNVYLPEYLNSITPILGAAGNQTNYKTEIAQSFINPQSSAASILATLKNVNQAVNDAYSNIASAASGGGTVAGGTTPGTPPPAPTNTNSGGIDWNSL